MIQVIMFGATEWCKSCRAMRPVFDKVADRFRRSRFKFQYVDVESEEGVEMSVLHTVRNVPTILFLNKKGKEMERLCGTQSYEMLVETLKKYMK